MVVSLIRGAMGLHRRYREHADAATARRKARKLKRQLEANETTNTFDTETAVTKASVREAGLLEPYGPYIGIHEGRPLFWPHDGHLHTYGLPGIGKGRDIGMPNMVHLAGKYSTVATDVDAEYARATAAFREACGDTVVIINPEERFGLRNDPFNPLQPLIDVARRGQMHRVIRYARQIALIALPDQKGAKGDTGWVREGARDKVLIPLMVHLAVDRPELCTLPWIYSLLAKGAWELLEEVYKHTDIPFVLSRMTRLHNELKNDAGKQVFWQVDEAAKALEFFEPGTPFAKSVSSNQVDFSRLKKEVTAVYVVISSDVLEDAAPYLAMLINVAIDQIADASGPIPTLILADEFANLPRIPVFLKAIRLYRKRGLQIWTFAQSRGALEERYGRTGVADLEANAAVLQFLSTDTSTARDIQAWSGTRTAFSTGMNASERLFDSGNVSGQETSLPRLSSAEVKSMKDDQQVLAIQGIGTFMANRAPWWEIHPWNDGRIKDLRSMPDVR